MIEWSKLRPINGSQNDAFEELCCQLARCELMQPGSKFIRKAPPDAGIECYWKLPSNSEWGWQAKFFTTPPNKNQWKQIDDSVKKALDKHPQLTRYMICLPIDRQDPKVSNQKWFMDKWNEHERKWRGWAGKKGMTVEFHYWGNSEILQRLSREEHRGRYFFWFNKEMLNQQWFSDRIDESIANAGPRYTPALNVELPIAQIFDGLGRTRNFYAKITTLTKKISKSFTKAFTSNAQIAAMNTFSKLNSQIETILGKCEFADELNCDFIDWKSLQKDVADSIENAVQCIQHLVAAAQENKKREATRTSKEYNQPEDFGYESHYLSELIQSLRELQEVTISHQARLSNVPALLLTGKAGTGKTHLFCDVAKQRINEGLPTIMLYSNQFGDEEPWTQMLALLGLSCTRDEFLGALEAAAQISNSRALIMIDALNEGEAKTLWCKYIAGMLTTLSRYSWIGIALSVRTSYVELVIPNGLDSYKIVREKHHGFAEREYEATETFFDYYGIMRPSIPLLIPEFQNPMFLKLFCVGLKNRGLARIPQGLQGITAIFTFFVESIDEKLSRPEYLDFDPHSHFVMRAVKALAKKMAVKSRKWIPREDAKKTVDSVLHSNSYEKSLFKHMISEGILAEERFYDQTSIWCEGIHFAYERFTDHFIVRHYFDHYLDPNDPVKSFKPSSRLGKLIKDETTCRRNRGIVEALASQAPERIGMELADVAPHCAAYRSVREAFVESLVWREPNHITDATLDYINKQILKYSDTYVQFLDAMLIVASNPSHPCNADMLHEYLTKFKLAERDYCWTIYINNQYGQHTTIDRLIDWARSMKEKGHLHEESLRLYGIAIAWCLTASNRYLRDNATKALVTLFSRRLDILQLVLREFLAVNDPYVLERLFAVAYGCAIRSTDDQAIGKLAQEIYNWMFKEGVPYPDILVRDYARGVIEYALHRKANIDVEKDLVRPPYKSTWPSFKIPSKRELNKYAKIKKNMPDAEWARIILYDSVMGSGDFARYIIGTNFNRFAWSSRTLKRARKPLRAEIYDDFVKALTEKQRKLWEKYLRLRKDISINVLRTTKEGITIHAQPSYTKEEILKAERAFVLAIGKTKHKIFKRDIVPYLKNPQAEKDKYKFDLSAAQRWIFQKIINLGWSVQRFGTYDRNVGRYYSAMREANKPERIGKKYQWIAFHEFLARVSDNFEFVGDTASTRPAKYEGPWQVSSVRDIDPSCLLRRTHHENWKPQSNTWWFPVSVKSWQSRSTDLTWLKYTEDLPQVQSLLEVVEPKHKTKWLVMEALYRWEQPIPDEEERYEIPHRELWYIFTSYIVKKKDASTLLAWAKRQDFMGRWMPHSHELYNVFLGECFWSPAFLFNNTPYYGRAGWTKNAFHRIPRKILVSTDQYMQEYSSYDCSIEDTINMYLPAKWLADGMQLNWNGVEGHFYTKQGKIVVVDPAVNTPGPGALLIDKNEIMNFLQTNGYEILWTVIGEKRIIGGTLSGTWRGVLRINGAYRIYRNRIVGKLKTKFISR